MRLYGAIQKVEPQDDGTVRVYGTATSEALDDQGEIVRADAMRAAIPEYMRFPALREMHQLSAAGTTLEAEVCEDGTTRIVAHVVDPIAVAKVKNQVYRGFSIGGRVLQREAGNPKTITNLVLNEISLVDRPANPEAVFDCWKAAIAADAPLKESFFPGSEAALTTSEQALRERAPFHPPIQIWACGVADHRHLAKAEAIKCLERTSASGSSDVEAAINTATRVVVKPESWTSADENHNLGKTARLGPVEPEKPYGNVQYADPGYQPDGRKRYPIDTNPHIRAAWNYINNPANAKKYTDDQLKRIKGAIITAWKDNIDEDGPPTADGHEKVACAPLSKALWDVGRVARVILDLDWLRQALDLEAAMENDNSPQPARLQEIVAELCEFLNALVTEETGEMLNDEETDTSSLAPTTPEMMAEKGRPGIRKLATGLLTKAKHSQGDQALVDMARLACDKCLNMGGLSLTEGDNLRKARDCLDKAGALTAENPGREVMDDVGDALPASASPPSDNAAFNMVKALGVMAVVLGKAGRAHQCIMDMAHECLRELTNGTMCEVAAKVGARHSSETMEHLEAAHRHLVAAGATCDAIRVSGSNALPEETQVDKGTPSRKGGQLEDLAKALAAERADKTALGKVLGEIVPMLQRLTQRVDDIARTPLPPLTIAKGTVSVSKQLDRGSTSGGDPELSSETVASALAKMSKEEQTLTLIKASYANPIRVLGTGLASAETMRKGDPMGES
jgi:uncharacterized protein DUF6582